MMWLILSILDLLLLGILVLIAFFAYVAARMANPPREIGEWTPGDFGLEYEEFEVENSEGIPIRGWHINRGSDCTVFLLHGYTVSRWTFYIKKMVEFLSSEDCNIVLFDFRAHGRSGGKFTTVGDKEIEDFRAVLNKFSTAKNCVVGYSMGGIIAIRSLLEDKVTCAIADSPPIYMDRTGRRGLRYFANLPEWVYTFAKPFFSLYTGGKIVNMMEYADKITKPLLLIAGENDPLVKVGEVMEFQGRNSTVNRDVSIWINSGAHVRGIVADEEDYRKRVLEFIRAHCSRRGNRGEVNEN